MTAELLDVAREAARAAAALLAPRFGSERALASKSTHTDMVSEADLAAERAIREVLAARRPDDGVLGEEGTGDLPGTTGLRWVVDPIDGTTNFLYGYPQWCVSVAVEDEAGSLAGVVLDPMRDELFEATRDGEGTLDGRPLGGGPAQTLDVALVATGFGYDAAVRTAQAEVIERVLPHVRDIRRGGSAALDLCWAAAGRVDAYYEYGIQPWDIAAGSLVCERAGLVVTQLPAAGPRPKGIAVARPPIAGDLLALLR